MPSRSQHSAPKGKKNTLKPHVPGKVKSPILEKAEEGPGPGGPGTPGAKGTYPVPKKPKKKK